MIEIARQASGILIGTMSFPKTRLTLIQRLVASGSETDWRSFLNDYWGPVCRFAHRWGVGTPDDAEDVASQTFAALWKNRLLVRWMASRSAKLRTLLCGVVRNILSNRNRVLRARQRLTQELACRLGESSREEDDRVDSFYAAWVEDLVQKAVRVLVVDYYRQGKGDHVRVLYGRLCQQVSIAELAETLGIKPSDVDNYYRHARQQLGDVLQDLVRRYAQRYCADGSAEDEFAQEWLQLGRHLAEFGGLEEAVRRSYDLLDPREVTQPRQAGLGEALTQITTWIRRSAATNTT
jgi:DNA-directed RNA polymerase specialized sigma24 family protein